MSPASTHTCSTTCSATSSMTIVTSPPGATPTRSLAPGSPSDGATASRTRSAMSSARSSTGSLTRSREHERAVVELRVPRREPMHRELLGSLVPGGDQSRARLLVVEQLLQGPAQRADVAGRHEPGVAVGTRDVLVALDGRRDDRRAGRHRLQKND